MCRCANVLMLSPQVRDNLFGWLKCRYKVQSTKYKDTPVSLDSWIFGIL